MVERYSESTVDYVSFAKDPTLKALIGNGKLIWF